MGQKAIGPVCRGIARKRTKCTFKFHVLKREDVHPVFDWVHKLCCCQQHLVNHYMVLNIKAKVPYLKDIAPHALKNVLTMFTVQGKSVTK